MLSADLQGSFQQTMIAHGTQALRLNSTRIMELVTPLVKNHDVDDDEGGCAGGGNGSGGWLLVIVPRTS